MRADIQGNGMCTLGCFCAGSPAHSILHKREAVMRGAMWAVLLALTMGGCSADRGRTTQMFPDCTQVSAEEQAAGKCMYRPEIPDGV